MPVLIRYAPPGLTMAQYTAVSESMDAAGVWPPDGLIAHVGFGPEGDMRVLIVEDDPEINQLLCAYAQIAGFEPDCALSGLDALSASAGGAHGLVLLDLMLPDIDGFEVCQRLKRDPDTRPVPVIMLTALSDDASRRRGAECGASEYLTKPFDPDRLMALLSRHAGAGSK